MSRWRLLQVHGVEIEYAIVDERTLEPLPIADWLITQVSGEPRNEAPFGDVTLGNELALHVVELKLPLPVSSLDGVAPRFQRAVRQLNQILRGQQARLLPTGMHPLMNPRTHTFLWPHGDAEIYREFHRLFDCARHGWANLQSTHLNLSFDGDEEFARLHAAVRLVLPLIPALAASSPIVEGVANGTVCWRLCHYRTNSSSAPHVTGSVVPEPVRDEEDHTARVLEPIRLDLARIGERGVLEPLWVNSRGAIARFDRGSIEIRLLDTQEHPAADLAISTAIVALVRALVQERWIGHAVQAAWDTQRLDAILRETTLHGGAAVTRDREYLEAFGIRQQMTASEVWQALVPQIMPPASDELERILASGPLATRVLRRLGDAPVRERIVEVYSELATCLDEGRGFD